MLKVSPISGVIAPYSAAQLQVTFKPPAPQLDKGFAGQPLAPQQQAQLFDCLLQVRVEQAPGRMQGNEARNHHLTWVWRAVLRPLAPL